VFGRNEIARLKLQKQALVLQSGLNRVELQGEVHDLRAGLGGIRRTGQKSAPWLVALAPVAGFFLVRSMRRQPASWLIRLVKATKWIGPAYGLWRTFSSRQEEGSRGRKVIPNPKAETRNKFKS
jgi:hypothetical protein